MKMRLSAAAVGVCLLVCQSSYSADNADAAQATWTDALRVLHDPNAPVLDGLSYAEALKRWGTKSPQFHDWYDRLRAESWRLGLQAWQQFPNDPKRYRWLVSSVQMSSYYWKDRKQGAQAYADGYRGKVTLDEPGRAQWLGDYLPLRNDLVTAADNTAIDVDGITVRTWKDSLRGQELNASIWRLQRLRDDNREKFDDPLIGALYTELKERLILDVLDMAITDPKSHSGPAAAHWLLRALDRDKPALRSLLAAMQASPSEEMRSVAHGELQVMKLQETPFQFKGNTLQGGMVDLAELRGRIVFVDVWSNYCSSCIAMMPKVQDIYVRYRRQGVEVVGVWCDSSGKFGADSAKDREIALAHLKRQGVTYPNALLDGEACRKFEENYSIFGYPVTWLFDREGKLVTRNLSGPKLEAEIRKVLGLSQ